MCRVVAFDGFIDFFANHFGKRSSNCSECFGKRYPRLVDRAR